MARKSLKLPINRNVMKPKEISTELQDIAGDMRRDEEVDIAEMFMELGRSQKKIEDTLTALIKKLNKEGLI